MTDAAMTMRLTDERIDAIAHLQDEPGEPAWFTAQLTKLEWRAFARAVESEVIAALAATPAQQQERSLFERAAEALAAYMAAMRADWTDDRESMMAKIRAADALAKPVYEELYAIVAAPPPASMEPKQEKS